MKQTINIHKAKTRLSQLIQQVEDGDEIIIARANKPVARLIAYQQKPIKRRLGEAKGMVEIMPDFDQLQDDFMEHFE
ncbi:type II toxin-antitoxin system Phd/YefM family antitoxin [Methylomicrobium sp. Wu6]|uniref:type II toxin-antitoxin system Phd/YefM family antitoxin n=1 Tax=Methylomicrobium sp. Wu6 TaxID=3107928 RepID=UPI002DD675FF|nr:type II toxin-antitoxin system Phd/YefM family antitoxin [Methylomicrobium sp. Wu6]MEC4747657.1 type II toxin-antitoxin system Phd/YefM family antitoxin [Methylomicrobium sp. Wu6]